MENKSKKRLAIYVHYDPKGEVHDYVLYCLNGLKEAVSEIMVVVNGKLSGDGRQKLESAGVTLFVRENKGFDFGAWKTAIEHIGYDNIAQYDELFLTNNSYYGPIYPFSEMWDAMDAAACDFWGVTMHHEAESNIPKHIQSYWLVFRKKILTSDIWRKYWVNLPFFNDFADVVFECEFKLTGHFEDNGFKSASYMSLEKYDGLFHGSPIYISDIQVIEDRCPILKKKYFLASRRYRYSTADFIRDLDIKKLMLFLEKNFPAFADMIWDDLLKTQYLSTFNNNLNLNFILSPSSSPEQTIHSKTAVIMHIHSEDMIEYCHRYAGAVPEYIDIVIVSASDAMRERCERFFSDRPNKKFYIVLTCQDRDITALLVTFRDILKQYDLICFVHTEQPARRSEIHAADALKKHCFSSLLYSTAFVENILEVFKSNPRLGVLRPFQMIGEPDYSNSNYCMRYYDDARMILKKYFNITEELLDPITLAHFGGMFWARTNALKTLANYAWNIDDFEDRPLSKTEGLWTFAIKRLIPGLAQNDGFYTAVVAPDNYAGYCVGRLYDANRKQKVCLLEQKHMFLLELKYTFYKFFRKIVTGDLRRHYRDNWLRLKAIRRLVKK